MEEGMPKTVVHSHSRRALADSLNLPLVDSPASALEWLMPDFFSEGTRDDCSKASVAEGKNGA